MRIGRAIEQHRLQRVTEREHQRHDHGAGNDQRHAGGGRPQNEKSAQHDQIAMREIDQPHDAENDRQAGGIERIKPAQQHSLQQRVDPAEHDLKVRNRRREWRLDLALAADRSG